MLKSVVKFSVMALLLTVVIGSAVSLQTAAAWFRPCPFPSCAVLPGGGSRVLCKIGRTGPIQVLYLNQCCCSGPDAWQNMYSFINNTPW